MMSIETALTTADLWSPPPPGTPAPPSSDTERFAVWLIRTRGDPEWNPDRADHAMPAWRDEMTRLISVYQRSRAMDDARRAAIHHAKLMHRHLLDLGYPVSAERDMETFVWWMAHREGWLNKFAVSGDPLFSSKMIIS